MDDTPREHDFSDEEIDAVLEQISEWGNEFEQTAHFDRLTPEQRAEAGPIVMTLAEFLYAYEGRRPGDWTTSSLERVATDIYPSKVSGEIEHFERVAPVFEAFLRFLGDRGALAEADTLANAVADYGDIIVSRAADPDHWGMAKSMLQGAVDEASHSIEEIATMGEMDAILDAAGVEELDVPEMTTPEPPDPSVLERDRARRFDWLFDSLLTFVNDRYDILEGIETIDDLMLRPPEQVFEVRNRMLEEGLANEIDAYVAENPHEVDADALEQIQRWRHGVHGDFVIMEYRTADIVFLDPDDPRAYAVKNLAYPLSQHWPASELPLPVSGVLLVPFDGVIVADGLIEHDPIIEMMWEAQGRDIEQRFEETRHRYGIAEQLPAQDESEATPVDTLRFYLKNQANRERYAEEIAELKDQTEELTRVYHEELGKAAARGLGREFRALDLQEAFVAIYDGQVVATAPTEGELADTLEAIMPPGRAEYPYVYHFDP